MSAPLTGGFAETPLASARAFRAALEAMARPGCLTRIEGAAPPAPLSPAAGALALTLLDSTTPLYLAASHDTPGIRAWLAFHTGAPLTAAESAQFALGSWESLHPLGRYPLGTAEYPDRSVTLIVERPHLATRGARLSGPGIETDAFLDLPEIGAFQTNRARFPLGFDCYFTCGDHLAGLPRSTKVEAG